MVNIKNIFRRKRNKNPLKRKNWNDISIKQYEQIVNIANEEIDTFHKNVKILSILWDRKEDEIMTENIDVIQNANQYTSFLNEFEFNKSKEPKHLTINNMECTITYDIRKMTYAQFVDFQTFYQMGIQDHMQNILSALIVPDGKKYGEGYDVTEFTEHIYNEMSITDAQTIIFFFVRKLICLFRDSRIYSISQLEKMKKITTDKKKQTEIAEAIQHLYGFQF